MSLRVLLVEDDAELRRTLREALTVEGYEVRTACSGADALAQWAHAPAAGFDLVLLDLGLPDVDGSVLLGQIRQRTPVIVVSARGAEGHKIALLDQGAAAAFAADPDPARARELVQAAQAQPPSTVAAHLELGRAYYVLGQYAEAKIEFETVLRFDNLPQGLLSQVEIYNQAATQALDGKRPLTGFGYAETGIGQYRVNNTVGTNALGGGDRRDTFYNARAGGGINYALPNDYAIDATLDYRFRHYDNSDSRNDSDLRWTLAGSRSFGDSNLAVGLRGRNSYRGDGDYRNDAGLFADYRYRVDPRRSDLLYRILIVDNESIIVDGLYHLFLGVDHHELDIYKAYSSSEALQQMAKNKIDIALPMALSGRHGAKHKSDFKR